MSDIGCEVYIEGSQAEGTYFTNCDNLKYIGDKGQNFSNSSITLYRLERSYYNQFNPYIRIDSFKYPRYFASQTQSQYIELTNITKVSFSPLGNYYHYKSYLDTGLIFAVFLIAMLKLIKKG